MRTLRRTPCVGICSTTYGDLVCRGCKRFAHEIVQWNAFEDAQRDVVWQRLLRLRAGAFQGSVRVIDSERVRAQALRLRIPEPDPPSLDLLGYEILRRAVAADIELAALGLEARSGERSALAVLGEIEQELYRRSVAEYERAYHIPAE